MNKYLSQFKLHQFLLEFPDPIEHFNNPDRKHAFIESKLDDSLELFTLKCLYNEFIFLRESDIKKVFNMTKKNVIKTYNKLKNIPAAFKTPREVLALPDISIKNMLLLQEVNTFISIFNIIGDFLKIILITRLYLIISSERFSKLVIYIVCKTFNEILCLQHIEIFGINLYVTELSRCISKHITTMCILL